jgi:ribosomal protein S27E
MTNPSLEIRKEKKIVETNLLCQECEEGQMVFNGMVYDTYPPYYSHTCTKCNETTSIFNKRYPHIEYVDAE